MLECRLDEANLLQPTVTAIVRFARDEAAPVKLAAASAASALVNGELAASASGSSASLKQLVPVLLALLGLDQTSDVQRAGMQVCM